MILDRDGLRLLFELSSRVEEVTGEATQVKDSLLSKPGEGRTPEDGYLEEIVSGLEGVERSISALISQYLPLVRQGGTLLVFSGLPKGEILGIDAGAVHYSEVSVKGCSGFALSHFREAFETIKDNEKSFRQLITHKFSFEHGQEAFDMLKAGKDFKILLGSTL